MANAWDPTTVQVADYVTSRTVSAATPGDDTPLGDFTADTYPTGDQVNRIIQGSSSWVSAEAGSIDTTLYDLATTVAALHAAAMVELTYPERNADVSVVAERLLDEAHRHLETLTRANAGIGQSGPDAVSMIPQYSFPGPPWYGDKDL